LIKNGESEPMAIDATEITQEMIDELKRG